MSVRAFNFSDGFTSSTAPGEFGAIVIVANAAIAGGGEIPLGSGARRMLKVSGSAAAQTASTTPFGATPPTDGVVIILMGTDNTNTLTITHNDIDDGCILNGDATLGLNDKITLVYDDTSSRYREQSRNF